MSQSRARRCWCHLAIFYLSWNPHCYQISHHRATKAVYSTPLDNMKLRYDDVTKMSSHREQYSELLTRVKDSATEQYAYIHT